MVLHFLCLFSNWVRLDYCWPFAKSRLTESERNSHEWPWTHESNVPRKIMLFFNFQIDTITGVLQYHDILKCRNRYPDLLQICGDFQIIVDKQIFFSQPQFPILEFCGAVRKWEKSHLRMRNMYYSSVETPPSFICLTNNGITEPLLPRTFPNRTATYLVHCDFLV